MAKTKLAPVVETQTYNPKDYRGYPQEKVKSWAKTVFKMLSSHKEEWFTKQDLGMATDLPAYQVQLGLTYARRHMDPDKAEAIVDGCFGVSLTSDLAAIQRNRKKRNRYALTQMYTDARNLLPALLAGVSDPETRGEMRGKYKLVLRELEEMREQFAS